MHVMGVLTMLMGNIVSGAHVCPLISNFFNQVTLCVTVKYHVESFPDISLPDEKNWLGKLQKTDVGAFLSVFQNFDVFSMVALFQPNHIKMFEFRINF